MEYNSYTALANAIIEQAVKDYRKADATPQARYAIKRFFLSEWFRMLTDLDGKLLVSRLEQEQKKKGRYRAGGYKA